MTGIRVRTDDFGVRRVAAVETEFGCIRTPCVVNCAGGKAFLLPPEGHPDCCLNLALLGAGGV